MNLFPAQTNSAEMTWTELDSYNALNVLKLGKMLSWSQR